MIWIAELRDGNILDQLTSRIRASQLSRDQVKRFRITESAGDTTMQFNSANGRVNFSCLDYTKLCGLEEAELKMKWDKNLDTFIMDGPSMEIIRELKLEAADHFFFIEFDEGRWNIYNQQFEVGAVIDGVEIPFNTAPYNFYYEIDHNEDFHMSTHGPVKKVGYDTAYTLTTKSVHTHGDMEFLTEQTIRYDVMKGHVIFEIKVASNRELAGSLYTKLADSRTADIFTFDRGLKLKRTTLMVV